MKPEHSHSSPLFSSEGLIYQLKKDGTLSVAGSIGCPNPFLRIPDTHEGKSVTAIEKEAFCFCRGILSVVLGCNLRYIGENAFAGCDRLAEIVNRSSLHIQIGSSDHGGIGRRAVAIHREQSGIRNVNGFFFLRGNNSISYLIGGPTRGPLILPSAFEESSYAIYDYAFCDRSDLTILKIPFGVRAIGAYAFCYCYALSELELPNSLTFIGDYAFSECSRLERVVNRSPLKLHVGSETHGYVAYYAKSVENVQPSWL